MGHRWGDRAISYSRSAGKTENGETHRGRLRGGPIKPYSNPPGQRKSSLSENSNDKKKCSPFLPPPFHPWLAQLREREYSGGEITGNVNYRPSLHIPFYVSFAINGEKVTVDGSSLGQLPRRGAEGVGRDVFAWARGLPRGSSLALQGQSVSSCPSSPVSTPSPPPFDPLESAWQLILRDLWPRALHAWDKTDLFSRFLPLSLSELPLSLPLFPELLLLLLERASEFFPRRSYSPSFFHPSFHPSRRRVAKRPRVCMRPGMWAWERARVSEVCSGEKSK